MTRRVLHAGAFAFALISAFTAGCGRESSLTGLPDPEPGAGVARLIENDDEGLTREHRDRARLITGPTIIQSPGVYRVARDFAVDASTADGIVVRANDVILFLDDHTLTGPGDRQGRGIVLDGVRRVLVQGGRLRSFGLGVAVLGTSHSAVRGVSIEGADRFADPPAGVAPQIGIMLVNAASNRIARNTLRGVNLGLFVRGGGSYENRLRWNDVVGGTNGLLGICYNPAPDAGEAGPRGDDVVGNALRRFGKGIQASAGSARNRFVGNWIEFYSAAYEDLNGTNIFERNRSNPITP